MGNKLVIGILIFVTTIAAVITSVSVTKVYKLQAEVITRTTKTDNWRKIV